MGAPAASPSAAPRRRWYRLTRRGALVCVSLVVLGMVAWLAYVGLPSGVEWPWLVAVVPAGLAGALALVEALLSSGAASQSAPPRRGRYQFSLRGGLLFIALIGLGLTAWRAFDEPYRQQQRVMTLVENLGGRYVASAGPTWLQQRFGKLTLIDVAQARPEDYLDSLLALPWLETLVVGGDDFTDEHLAQLAGLRSLRALVLDSTDVSDEAIAELRRHLPDLTVRRSQRLDRTRFGGGATATIDADRLDEEPWAPVSQHVSEHFSVLLSAHLPRGIVHGDEKLAELRRLPTVRSLALSECTIGVKNCVTDAGLEAVARLRDLETLYLPDTLVTDTGLGHLTRLERLQSLNLTGNPQLTDAALKHVGQLSRLYSLNLTGTSVAGPGLEYLRGLTNLKSLDLGSTPLTGPGLEHLRGLPNLSRLDLQQTRVDDESLVHLKQLESVNDLDLSNTKVTGPGLRHLAQLPKLWRINLQKCPVTDDGLETTTTWASSPYLNLSGTKITDRGVRYLARNKSWRGLDLSHTGITNAALDALEGMDKLESLTLNTTEIDDDGAAKLERIKSLKSLDCRGSNITAEGKARLKQALPGLSTR